MPRTEDGVFLPVWYEWVILVAGVWLITTGEPGFIVMGCAFFVGVYVSLEREKASWYRDALDEAAHKRDREDPDFDYDEEDDEL